MRIFFVGQVEYNYALNRHEIPLLFSGGRAKICGEAVLYVRRSRKPADNPAMAGPSGIRAIYGWTLI